MFGLPKDKKIAALNAAAAGSAPAEGNAHVGASQPVSDDIAQLTGAVHALTATVQSQQAELAAIKSQNAFQAKFDAIGQGPLLSALIELGAVNDHIQAVLDATAAAAKKAEGDDDKENDDTAEGDGDDKDKYKASEKKDEPEGNDDKKPKPNAAALAGTLGALASLSAEVPASPQATGADANEAELKAIEDRIVLQHNSGTPGTAPAAEQ